MLTQDEKKKKLLKKPQPQDHFVMKKMRKFAFGGNKMAKRNDYQSKQRPEKNYAGAYVPIGTDTRGEQLKMTVPSYIKQVSHDEPKKTNI